MNKLILISKVARCLIKKYFFIMREVHKTENGLEVSKKVSCRSEDIIADDRNTEEYLSNYCSTTRWQTV